MRRIVFPGVFILLFLLDDTRGVLCKSCNLSVPFHGCLLDFGTCRTKPGQYCIKEIYIKGGIHWYTIKGCTEDTSECFKREATAHELYTTYCCYRPMCNL